jgi:predicted secreted protein
MIPTIKDIINFVFVFILIWWVVIFAVLPFGNAPSEKKDMALGQAASAPAKPRLKQKFIWTSLIALLINVVIFSVMHYTGFQLFGPEKTL